jgi:hemoglobin
MSERPFERLGGEQGIRRLVDRFYDLMDSLPEASELRGLHPRTLDGSRDKLAWYLTGWLGGPQRYVERFGHPRLRARHLPFTIGARERDQWMLCMRRALAELVDDGELRAALDAPLAQLADHLRNQAETEAEADADAGAGAAR